MLRGWPTTTKLAALAVVVSFAGAGYFVTRPSDGEERVSAAGESGRVTTSTPQTTAQPEPPPPQVLAAPEHRVVAANTDGDTLRLADGTRVRLIGIDAPDAGRCFSAEAVAHLRQLVPPETDVRLEYGPETLDTFGRALAYMYRLSDDLLVNRAMVEEGYAVELTVAPNIARAEEFRAAEQAAKAGAKGLWKACPGMSAAAAATTTTTVRPPVTARSGAAPPVLANQITGTTAPVNTVTPSSRSCSPGGGPRTWSSASPTAVGAQAVSRKSESPARSAPRGPSRSDGQRFPT